VYRSPGLRARSRGVDRRLVLPECRAPERAQEEEIENE
jgi:hypothetical protein